MYRLPLSHRLLRDLSKSSGQDCGRFNKRAELLAIMRLFGYDLYIEVWGWPPREWQTGYEQTHRGDILLWVGPLHLAISRLDVSKVPRVNEYGNEYDNQCGSNEVGAASLLRGQPESLGRGG